MSVKVCWPAPWEMEDAAKKMIEYLISNGYEVDDTRKGYKVFSFRRDHKTFTHAYTGLTCRAKETRNGLKLTGPEEDAIPEFAFYEDGIFFGANHD